MLKDRKLSLSSVATGRIYKIKNSKISVHFFSMTDIVHSVLCMFQQESFEGQMTEDNIEVGICNEAGFRRLSPAEVKDYLAAIA